MEWKKILHQVCEWKKGPIWTVDKWSGKKYYIKYVNEKRGQFGRLTNGVEKNTISVCKKWANLDG